MNGDGHLFLSNPVITFCETLEYGCRHLRVLVISSCWLVLPQGAAGGVKVRTREVQAAVIYDTVRRVMQNKETNTWTYDD